MDETQEYFIDILKLAPINSDCYVQSPHDEILNVLNNLGAKNEPVYKVIKLTDENKEKLIQATFHKHIEEFIQSMEIRFNDKLFFEGYDGMEYGTISNTITLPGWFLDKYVRAEMCNISNEW